MEFVVNESVNEKQKKPDHDQINTSEMVNMRERCKEYEESLKHRYFKIKTGLKDVANESDSENEEPERPMRF